MNMVYVINVRVIQQKFIILLWIYLKPDVKERGLHYGGLEEKTQKIAMRQLY